MAVEVNDTAHYALIILFASAVGLVAVLANRPVDADLPGEVVGGTGLLGDVEVHRGLSLSGRSDRHRHLYDSPSAADLTYGAGRPEPGGRRRGASEDAERAAAGVSPVEALRPGEPPREQ